MNKVIYLNKWNAALFHVILVVNDDDIDYTFASRVCTSLSEARRLVHRWQCQHAVGPDAVRDNSMIDLGRLLAGIEPRDFSPADN